MVGASLSKVLFLNNRGEKNKSETAIRGGIVKRGKKG